MILILTKICLQQTNTHVYLIKRYYWSSEVLWSFMKSTFHGSMQNNCTTLTETDKTSQNFR